MSKAFAVVLDEEPQQVLGEQDAGDLVAVLADDGEPRVAGFDHDGQDLLDRVVAIDHDHLRARHHHVAHLDLGDLEHRLEHLEHVGVDQAAIPRVREHVGELFEIARFAGDRFGDAAEPAAGERGRPGVPVTTHSLPCVAQR